MIYLITYNKVENELAFEAALKTLGENYKDPGMSTVQFLLSSLDLNEIKDKLIPSLSKDGRLFVTKLMVADYSGWMSKSTWEWINKNLK